MNETNIKHGYSLMASEARGAILNPGSVGHKFQKQGQHLCHQGRNIEVRGAILGPPGAGYFNYVSPGGWTCQVMHSGVKLGYLFMTHCRIYTQIYQCAPRLQHYCHIIGTLPNGAFCQCIQSLQLTCPWVR